MGAQGADWCVGRDRELPPYGNRVITSPGLQGQLMAFPPWPGACQPLPWPQGRGKAQVGLEPQAQAGHRVRSPSAEGLGPRDRSLLLLLLQPPGRHQPPDTKVQGKFASPKDSLEGNLEAGTFGGHGFGDLRLELELEHLVASHVTTDTSTRFSASRLPDLKMGLRTGSVGAQHQVSAPLADENLSPEADVTLGSHVIWEQQSYPNDREPAVG